MAKMKVAQVPKAGADFEIAEREIPQPGTGEGRIRVQACGGWHSDLLTKEGGWPGIGYPRVPGHEVAAGIDEAGPGAAEGRKGQRVGVGWDGGPENTVLAQKLGANVYIDSAATSAAAELKRLGGARVILATAPSGKAMASLFDGLGMNGRMMVVGAALDPIEVTPVQLIFGRRSIQGWSSGIPTDSEDTLRFAELTGVRPMIEKYPLARVNEAYAHMMSGKAKFRVVLTM